jgi:hypothetical protein
MSKNIMRAALIFAGCTGVMACPQPVRAADPAPVAAPPVARTCSVQGGQAQASVAPPKTMTVSNEGGWCSDARSLGSLAIYEVTRPPQHGQLAQHISEKGYKIISYKPAPGFTGSDIFVLRWADKNIEMVYNINVVR